VRNSLPVSTVAELIAFAKTNRGKLNFATTGIGTTPHLTGDMLKRWPQSTSPPYRNSAPALNDRLVGAVDAVIDNTTSIVPQARAGSIRALGISTLTRWPLAPDFAPIADTVAGFAALAFSGVAVRSGTPAEICDSVEAAVKAVCKDPVLIERMTPLLAEVVGSGAKEFGEFIAAERANGENCSPTSKSVSATSLKPLFAGDTPAPTQAYASQALRVTAVARSPPPNANARSG
jgi:tripartite-type tricarboxylate transporter receptor subunit TctC